VQTLPDKLTSICCLLRCQL